MKSGFLKFISAIVFDTRWFAAIIFLICIFISLQHYLLHPTPGTIDFKYNYTHYNDYLIFKYSFSHLLHHQDLYVASPYEYYDLFKYTPTFALLMAPFATLPNLAGLILWNLLNAYILFFALRRFPFSASTQVLFAIGFVLIEAITSLQNSESNCLLAGLFLSAYLAMENKKLGWATFLLVLSIFIKPFGLAFFSLFIFYPKKGKAILYSAVWFALLLLLPLMVVSARWLADIYRNWGMLLISDQAVSQGFSVMGWLQTWFGINQKFPTLVAGIILFLLPLVRYKCYSNNTFRTLYLSFILIWVVIFNHIAESPTYVIAISGVAIWFTRSSSKVNVVLLLFCFFFSVLSSTDIFPPAIRRNYLIPYVVKTVPCIFIWIKILFELLTATFPADEHSATLQPA